MKELEIQNPIDMKQEQFECPVCEIKFYLNEEDIKDTQAVGCCFCDIPEISGKRVFEIQINKIFEK